MQEGLLEGMRYPKGQSPVFNPSTMGFFGTNKRFFFIGLYASRVAAVHEVPE